MTGQLILLGTPRELHIPAMAMPSASAREDRASAQDLSEVAKLAGRKSLAWIQARQDRGSIKLIGTRNYVPLQTAFYANWLVIGDEAVAREFLEAFPSWNLDFRLAKLSDEIQKSIADIKLRLDRGDFNLGRVGNEEQRENLARRYVEIADKRHQSETDFRLLEMAKELGEKWQSKL